MSNRQKQVAIELSVADRLRAIGYEVLHNIGAGSGGQVHKAIQLSTGQVVAIKLLTSGDADAEANARRIERFRREIGFCSSLYHPDIVRLLDSGVLGDDSRFAVFEFIPGRTLAELLRDEGMLTAQRARNLMAQLLPPLAYAHEKRIAHRDLKPSNVMVMSDGGRDRVKILDFGISVSTAGQDDEHARLTQSHEWLGTPLYAAPEQLRGESAGPRSDIYAWALMFVECLTGRTLISGKSLAEIIALQFRPEQHALPPVLAQHRLGALLLRALEKDPARRLSDAQLTQSLLERISLQGLEDAQGYLRDAAPVSAEYRARQRQATDTVTDVERHEQTEQRRVTALCCRVSLVGTGGLSGVEQLDALLDDSYNLMNEILQQFGATPAQTLGGYSLWYFGLSHTREADARMAVRGALEIVNRLEKLPSWFRETGFALNLHVGIHNGIVTVQFSDERRKAVDGMTARLALELAALPRDPKGGNAGHRVLVSEEFQQLVARYADLERLEGAALTPGWSQVPLGVFRLTGESRSTSLRPERAAFVGRNVQLQTLLDAWRRTGTGEGTAMLIEGEPGVGKSRLAAELMSLVDAEGCRALEARCLPEWQNASLRPLRSLMMDLLGVNTATSTESSLHLESGVNELGLELTRAVPLLCTWLSLPLPAGYVALAWSPQKQRQALHETIADALLVTMDRNHALLLEDIHWADPSTLECLDRLLVKAKSRSVLIVLTTRPGRTFNWTAGPEQLVLGGLDQDAARMMARALLPDWAFNRSDVGRMLARADGIPLYLEELALALKAQPRTDSGGELDPRGLSKLEQVPPSLRELLMSRLEHIGKSLATAQFAAALGREFSLELLASLLAKDELSLLSDLEELMTAQVLTKRLRLDSPVYLFRHALIRDAAYDSMSSEQRKRTHELIAETLEHRFEQSTGVEPDVVAHHFDRAFNIEKAVSYWHVAARRASAGSAHAEAISYIDRALELLRSRRQSAELELDEAPLLLTRGAIIVAKRGYTDPEAKACFERIVQILPADSESLPTVFAARWGLWYFNNTRCNLVDSCLLADELRRLADSAPNSAMSLSAWAAVCQSRFCTGRLEESVAASRSCAAEYDLERHRHLALRYGDDPRVSAGSFEVLAEVIRGRFDVARERIHELFEIADTLGYPSLKAGLHGQAAWAFLTLGGAGAAAPDYSEARHHALEAIRIAREHGFPFWEIYGTLNEAAIRVAEGDPDALPELMRGAQIWLKAGANLGRCWHLTFIGHGLHQAGQFGEAQQKFDEALTFCEERGSRYFESEVRRRRAALLADERNPNANRTEALAQCRRAASDAASRGARWWQLASLMTATRLTPSLEQPEAAELAELVASFPRSANEPPLVTEARIRAT